MPFRLVRGRGYAERLYLLRSQPTVGPQAPAVSLPLVYGAAFDHTEADRCEVEAQPGLAIPHHAGKRADLEPFDDAAEHGTYGRVAPVAVREPGAAAAAGGRPARTGRYVEAEVDGIDRQVLPHEAGGLVERRAGVAHTHRGIACRPQPQPELGGERGARRHNVRLYATYPQASPQHRAVSQRRNDVATRRVARAIDVSRDLWPERGTHGPREITDRAVLGGDGARPRRIDLGEIGLTLPVEGLCQPDQELRIVGMPFQGRTPQRFGPVQVPAPRDGARPPREGVRAIRESQQHRVIQGLGSRRPTRPGEHLGLCHDDVGIVRVDSAQLGKTRLRADQLPVPAVEDRESVQGPLVG